MGIAAQANRGSDAREFFDGQIVMWRAIVLAPYGLYWFFCLLLFWLLVVLWTGHKAETDKAPTPPEVRERKQAVAPRSKSATEIAFEQYERLSRQAEADARIANAARITRRDRDAGVAEALGWAVHASWDRPVGSALVLSIPPLSLDGPIERFREAAEAGDLRVWGRRSPEGLIELIDKDFWADNTVSAQSLKSPFSPTSTVPLEGIESGLRFYGIMVNRAEVERVWPHAG